MPFDVCAHPCVCFVVKTSLYNRFLSSAFQGNGHGLQENKLTRAIVSLIAEVSYPFLHVRYDDVGKDGKTRLVEIAHF